MDSFNEKTENYIEETSPLKPESNRFKNIEICKRF